MSLICYYAPVRNAAIRPSVRLSVCPTPPAQKTVHLGLWLLQTTNRKPDAGSRTLHWSAWSYGRRTWPKRQRNRRLRRLRCIRQVAAPSMFPVVELLLCGTYRLAERYLVIIAVKWPSVKQGRYTEHSRGDSKGG